MGLSGLSHLNLQEQGINFATRCIELQHAVRILEKKNLELQEKAAMKEEELIKANTRTKLLHQPQSYLVDAIQSSESQLKQTLQENQELEIQLRQFPIPLCHVSSCSDVPGSSLSYCFQQSCSAILLLICLSNYLIEGFVMTR
jgi:chromosome segregation ATPase